MHSIKSVLALALCVASSMSFADDEFCLPAKTMTINGIPFMGKSALIKEVFGKPIRIKKWYRDSEGNEGSYFMNDYVYNGAVFSARIGNDHQDRVQKVVINGPSVSVAGMMRVGLTIDQLKEALDYKEDIKLEKSRLKVFQCDTDGTRYIEFRFSKKGQVDQIIVEYDSDWM